MNITALRVDGFGVWSGLQLDDLAQGLNVFYGPNEAGKTTLMQFVRTMLYGFSPQRRRYLPPPNGGRPGGWLQVTGPVGRVQVGRYLDKGLPNGKDCVELTGADGTPHDASLVRALVADVDEVIFNNVFAVGLRELQQLGTLSDTDAAAMLYNLSVGVDRVSLVDVVGGLASARNRILPANGQDGEIAELVAKRESLRSELEQLGALLRRYGRVTTDREHLEKEIVRLEQELKRLRHEAKVTDVAIAVRDRWRRRRELDQRLSALGSADAGAEQALERLGEINSRTQRHQALATELAGQWEQLRSEHAGLGINEALWQQAPRIEVLAEQEQWIGTVQQRISELESEISQLEGHLASEKERFGMQDAIGTAAVRSLSPDSVSALKQPARALRLAQRRLEAAQREMSERQETSKALQLEIAETLDSRGETDLAEAMDRAGGQVAQLRRRTQMDDRLDHMHQYRKDLEDQSRALLDQRVLPAWMLLALGAVFVTGVVLLLTRLFMPDLGGGLSGGSLTALGIAATLAAIFGKILLERSAARRFDGCQEQLRMLDAQAKTARGERDSLDRNMTGDRAAVVSQLRAAERDLGALEELVPLDARRRAAEQEAEAAEEKIGHAQSRLATALQRWRDALESLGLPGSLSPRQVKGLVSGSDDIVDSGRRLEIRYEELQGRMRELESLTARVARVAEDANVSLEPDDARVQLRELVRQTAEQEMLLRRRDELRQQARRLRPKRAKNQSLLRRFRKRRRELLARAGASDERQLGQLAAQAAQARSLRTERQTLEREINAALAGHCTQKEVAEKREAHPGHRMQAHRTDLAKRLQAAEADLQKQFEKRGRLAEQLSSLVEDRSPAAKRLELAIVEHRLQKAVQRWQALALTSRVLDSIRTTYERDRQPETLCEASRYLERMTEGRYNRIWTPIDEDVLVVDGADGKPWPVEVLSQGTREQLFVSLRLALASSYARRGICLPVILDDVLVNFDTQRASAAAALLRDFAHDGHQLLVFTCHEHISELFRSIDVPVTDLPASGELQPAVPVACKRSRSRRKPVRKPQPARQPEPTAVPPPEEPAEPKRQVAAEDVSADLELAPAEPNQPPRTQSPLEEYPLADPFERSFGFVPWTEDILIPEEDSDPIQTSPGDQDIRQEELDFADEEPSDMEPAAKTSDEYELAPIDEDEPLPRRHPVSRRCQVDHAKEPATDLSQDGSQNRWLERYDCGGDIEAA